MRVSVVNFCSTRADMLAFSTEMLHATAGIDDFQYFVVTWLPSPAVVNWIDSVATMVHRIPFETQPGLDYVPQLRAMMNHGFDVGYQHADWVCLVNTDMAFGRGWLRNLIKNATSPDVIPNSVHITPTPAEFTPAQGRAIIRGNFGIPTDATFDLPGFWAMHDSLTVEAVDPEGPEGWKTCATFPYLLHRQWWDRCGPWEVNLGSGHEAPDRRFFRRCSEAGARFVLCRDSIVYHHEAVERRGARPPGAEHLAEGA